MKKKNNLFRNIFYIFFAICFLSAGTFVLNNTYGHTSAAEATGTSQNLPDYFSVKEFEDDVETTGLVSSDIFLYAPGKKFSISLATNGVEVFGNLENSVYEYVYYPNTTDTSTFYFYQISAIELKINGVKVDGLVDTNFVTNTGKYFTNYSDTLLQTFKMDFTEDGANNSVSLSDNFGNIIEGQYTLTLNYTLFTCNNGKTDASEDSASFSNTIEQQVYNFYVVDQSNYLTNRIPNVSIENFDHKVNSPSVLYDYYLYSNYSLEGKENKIAYIEYDYTRYELEITRDNGTESNAQIVYDTDTNEIVTNGEKIVSFTKDEANHTAKVFFYDLGNYAITYKDILHLDYEDEDHNVSLQKHYLDGLSSITKKMMVYVYGLQANYTDMDGTLDENNSRPIKELKTYDFANETFNKSADITSSFLNSNPSYSQEDETSTFTISKIVSYIDENQIIPVVTNQTPIRFATNAALTNSSGENYNVSASYIYSTKKVSANYKETDITLGGETLYSTHFNGQAEGTVGKYIYVIAYTFTNYYSSSATRAADKVFYQVFYFEISKKLPSINITTIDNETIYSDSFTRKSVTIEDTTKENPYNREVEIRIYAKDFYGNYVDGFDHESGVDFYSLTDTSVLTLTRNAHYTIRMYNKSEVNATNILLTSKTGFFREQKFTIDNSQIVGISATNVSEIINSTNYNVVSTLNRVSTNQNIVLSWNEKDSGARTYAYYRYFKIQDFQYYSTAQDYLSDSIKRMIQYSSTDSFLPINATLDLNTENNNWFNYEGNANTQIETGVVSSDYVLSDEGLYLIEVCDEAGNKTFDVFIIDYTTPLFALQDENGYTLANGSTYISRETTAHWAKYKSLYVSSINKSIFGKTPEAVQESDLSGEGLFVDNEGNSNSIEIYTTFYNKLKSTKYLQNLVNENKAGAGSALVDQPYTGLYLTIPVNSTYYYLNVDKYEERQNAYKEKIEVDTTSSESEKTYRILIRDNSNTKYFQDPDISETHVIQYTQYYSAAQKLSVSFDTSNFIITYTYHSKSQQIQEDMTSNNEVVDRENSSKTTYLNPTRMSEAFKLHFTPTQIEGGSVVQVDRVTIKYYKYEQVSPSGENFTYYQLSDNATETVIYEYTGEFDTAERVESIRLNSDGKTMPGKYEITRVYRTGDGFTYNENDYFSRTFVLYVDRNEVISNPDLIDSKDSNRTAHLESLVGGDIFVAMYDNKENANLVVTFPDSTEGNQKGSSLYNNGNARTIFTTNMLPVNVYIPKYKYTINTTKDVVGGQYDFVVNNNDKMNLYDQNVSSTGRFDPATTYIPEYVLYAEIYFNSTNNLIAKSQNSLAAAQTNGFLNLYKTDGTKLNGLTEAGSYYVTIYQGMFGTEIGVNNYLQSITFTFDVLSSAPEFVATTNAGSELEYAEIGGITTYYTNNSTIKLSWQGGSDYMAEIDLNNIKFAPSNSRAIWSSEISNEIWSTPVLSKNNIYTATLNLQKLGIYSNDKYVDITMQYKNHNDALYSKVTKRIVVDLSAPSTNISNLVQKSISGRMFSNLKESALRIYNTANNEVTNDLSITSYNISNGTGDFAYYSYMVTAGYKDTLISSKDFMTYVRKFQDSNGNITKYTANAEQETSPETFLASNFTSIEKTEFEVGAYYEIVETDRAGNMAIYTIYVTSYNSQGNEHDNLLTYTNSNGETTNYTIADYDETKTYSGALNNIYDKPGFQLEKINYFGDVWAQIKYESINANGVKTTYYLMLSPWKLNQAIEFVPGSESIVYDISTLYDGTINSKYKSSLSFFNRENGQTEKFFINTRNTDLVANMTNDKNKEYISFETPTDATINNELTATTYLTKLRISTNESVLYDQTNNLGFASLWESNSSISVTNEDGKTKFELNSSLNFPANTKIIYEFTNNYGKTYTEVHLYRETVIRNEITSENDMYAFYTTNGIYYYITQNGFQYSFNPNKYSVAVYDYVNGQKSDEQTQKATITSTTINGVRTITLHDVEEENYNDSFIIEVSDITTAQVTKTYYVILYNELPLKNLDSSANTAGQFKLVDATRNNITKRITESLSSDEMGYFSEVTLTYSLASTFIPVKYSYSTDKIEWTEALSGTKFTNSSEDITTIYLKIWYDTTYLKNELGSAEYVFQDVPRSQIYEFNLSSLTSTFWVEKTIDGVTTIVERSNTIFKIDGRQYSNHYIVNLNYSTDSNAVQIKTNKEQGITATPIGTPIEHGDVRSQLWRISNEESTIQNISKFSTYIVISFIPDSKNFVDEFFTYNATGMTINLKNNNEAKATFVIPQEGNLIGKLKLQWTKYYGIEQNEIKIAIVKDGIQMTPTIYSENNYNFCYLPYSGKYSLSLYDTAGNIQRFNYGSLGQTDIFTLIFLKDVPFTITYTNPETENFETSLPIKQAVYNGEITININNTTRPDFYKVGGYPKIKVVKNGVEIENFDDTKYVENGKTKYKLTESGSYEVTFVAESAVEGVGTIKQETYQFTIINKNEHRYSYIVNSYSNYYIESVKKNGIDVTQKLVETLNSATLTINKTKYLTELPLSYLDEKTGEGTYLIKINSNSKDLTSDELPTSWVFQVIIKSGTAPIAVSIDEGKSTDNAVVINYNKSNIYEEMGECSIRIIKYDNQGRYHGVVYTEKIDSTSTGQATATIIREQSGIFYVQVVSSDNVLYSYKVSKTEPMNAAAIIAIVSSVVLVIVIGFIVLKLRKRISVK